MKHLIRFAVIGAIAVMFGGMAAGEAGAVECDQVMTMKIERTPQDALYVLCSKTQETWFKNPTDRESLKGKVVMAGAKVDQGKTSDASQKLTDYETTLRGLMDALKKKVDVDQAQNQLLPALDGAQMAITNLN